MHEIMGNMLGSLYTCPSELQRRRRWKLGVTILFMVKFPEFWGSPAYIIIASPLQQWLHERTSVLRYTFTAYLVINFNCRALKYSCRAPYSVLTFNLCQIHSAKTYSMKTKHLPLYHLSHSFITTDASKPPNCLTIAVRLPLHTSYATPTW
jgi:hypothetical protein